MDIAPTVLDLAGATSITLDTGSISASGPGVTVEGTTAEIMASGDGFVRQFVDALPDGPVAFHYPSAPYPADLRLSGL